MSSGSYFTNLMSNDFTYPGEYVAGQSDNMEMPAFCFGGQPDDTPASNELLAQDDAHGVAKEKKRRKKFNVDEDKLLMSAWLNVSQDPIQGVNQAYNIYWGRIHHYFHANKNFDSNRSQISIMNRWSDIQHDVNVFCGCLSRIEARTKVALLLMTRFANTPSFIYFRGMYYVTRFLTLTICRLRMLVHFS
jgi:hypothetical protein